MKQISNFENYYAYEDGRIYSAKFKRFLKPSEHNQGYHVVGLRQNGKKHAMYVHRIIADTFIDSVVGKTVNHKNFDRTDNRVENLEVVTQKENNMHARKNGRAPSHFRQFYLDKELICEMYSYGIEARDIRELFQISYDVLRPILKSKFSTKELKARAARVAILDRCRNAEGKII